MTPGGCGVHASQLADGVVAVTFNNPTRYNALTPQMVSQAIEVLSALAVDAGTRVIVLRGAGQRAFLSGADIGQQDGKDGRTFLRDANAMIAMIGELSIPVIAMIQGYCLGAGMAIALEADLRLASPESVFGIPAARLGLGYPAREVARLEAMVGPGPAADLMFTGRHASADEARAWGLVAAVHPLASLEHETVALARSIAGNAPLVLRAAKRAIRAAAGRTLDAEHGELDRLVEACFASADYAEGRRAFAEKRVPRFIGR